MREEYDEVAGGLTLKKIANYLKMALPYVLVCLVIVVMIGVASVAILSEINKKSNEKVQAIFELTYAGADDGLAPNKEQLDIQKFKSIGRINKVIGELGFEHSPSAVQNAITINGYYSPAMRALIESLDGKESELLKLIENTKLNPTQFVVNFDYKSIPKMSSNHAITILEELLKLSKVLDFSLTDTNAFINSGGYDDPQITSMSNLDKLYFLKNELSKMSAFVYSDSKINSTLKIALNSAIQENISTVADAKYFILSNLTFVTDTITLDNKIAQLDVLVKEVNNKILVHAQRVTDQELVVKAMVDNLKIIINDKGEIINAGEGGAYITELYDMVYSEYLGLLSEKANLANELNYFNEQKTVLVNIKNEGKTTPLPENIAIANQKVANALNAIKNIAGQVESYTNNQNISAANKSGLKVALAPVDMYESMFSPSWLMGILSSAIVGILLGLIIAYPVDMIIKRKASKKKQTAKAVEGVDDTEIKKPNNLDKK